MCRQFFYVSLGILALTMACGIVATNASADWDPDASTCIIGFSDSSGPPYHVFANSGDCYVLWSDGSWQRDAVYDLPVSTSEIRLLGREIIVTHGDVVWDWDNALDQWVLADPFPGCASPTEETSWGRLKAKYR